MSQQAEVSRTAGRARPPAFIRRALNQFKRPHGILGRLAGWIMATRPSNVQRNLWTVDLLDVQPRDRVLEVGFGPGVAMEAVAAKASDGHILGIDHSELMNRTAAKRNRAATSAGRIELRLGTLSDLRPDDGPFEKIFAVNCAQFWDGPDQILATLREALVEGGVMAITYQPRHPGASEADADAFAERVADMSRAAGFSKTRTEKLDLEPVCAVCVLMTK